MLRTNGSAQQTRRWTKGGSLPRSPQADVLHFTSNGANGASRPTTPPQDGADAHANAKREAPVNLRSHLVNRNSSSHSNSSVADNAHGKNGENVATRLPRLPLWKRVLDLVLVLGTFPLWLPVMILVMILIKLGSAGPILYRQERVGYRGKLFMIFKFRSMKVNAETDSHKQHLASLMGNNSPMTKLDAAGDPRLIPLGRVFRATGLDELPQIFNVIRGEMSLVGPRPCLPYEFQRYEPWQQERVNAAPGLTGYWQVNGKNKTTFSEMIEMDIYYSRNMSLLLDLTILFKTAPAIMQQVFEAQHRTRVQHVAAGSVRREPSRLTT